MSLLDGFRKLTQPYDDDEFYDDGELRPTDPPEERQTRYERQPQAERQPRAERQPQPERPSRAERQPQAERPDAFLGAPPAPAAPQPSSKERDENKVVNIHTTAAVQVVIANPERFEQAKEIADHLRDRRTVVMNLERTKKEVAIRLVDFLSGVAYANDGKIKKVAINTYIITPYNVGIQGDLIDELENNGVHI